MITKTNITFCFIFVRTPKMSRQLSRSPVFSRSPQIQIQRITEFDFDTSHLTFQPMSLVSLSNTESILLDNEPNSQSFYENRMINSLSSSTINKNNKRSFNSSSPEQIFVKRRYNKSTPSKHFLSSVSYSNVYLYFLLIFFL